MKRAIAARITASRGGINSVIVTVPHIQKKLPNPPGLCKPHLPFSSRGSEQQDATGTGNLSDRRGRGLRVLNTVHKSKSGTEVAQRDFFALGNVVDFLP